MHLRDSDAIDDTLLDARDPEFAFDMRDGVAPARELHNEHRLVRGHSEKNGSADEPMRFIQFWILPSAPGLATTVQQQQHTLEDRTDRWLQIMGPAGTDGLDLAQDARAVVSHLTEDGRLEHTFAPERGGYLYVIHGRLSLNGDSLRTGDAAKVTGEATLEMSTEFAAELILIDVPLEFQPIGVWAGEF